MTTIDIDPACTFTHIAPNAEQSEIMYAFVEMLAAASGDGGNKRAAGTKPLWKVDPAHKRAIFSHIAKWADGEKVDPDSGAHPLVHAAWRCLAVAWQEVAEEERRKAASPCKCHVCTPDQPVTQPRWRNTE